MSRLIYRGYHLLFIMNKWIRVADCPIEEGGVVDVRSEGYSVVEGGYVLCGRHIWQYFPEEDVDSELVAE